jgi:plasmid stabilization system protein ParE
MADYLYSREARTDLNEIWEHTADDNIDIADRVEREIDLAVQMLARNPRVGHCDVTLHREPCCSGGFTLT